MWDIESIARSETKNAVTREDFEVALKKAAQRLNDYPTWPKIREEMERLLREEMERLSDVESRKNKLLLLID